MSLTIAFPDGPLGASLVGFFERAGLSLGGGEPAAGERRSLPNGWTAVVTTAGDVAVCVERGALDVGLLGRETLLEGCPSVSELARLPLRHARLVFAWVDGEAPRRAERRGTVRVATPFPRVAAGWLAALGREAEPVALCGAGDTLLLPALADATLTLVEEQEAAGDDATLVAECGVSLIAGHAARALRGDEIAALLVLLRDVGKAAEPCVR